MEYCLQSKVPSSIATSAACYDDLQQMRNILLQPSITSLDCIIATSNFTTVYYYMGLQYHRSAACQILSQPYTEFVN